MNLLSSKKIRLIVPVVFRFALPSQLYAYVKLDTDFNPSSADTQYSDDFPEAWTETDDWSLNPTGELEIAGNILNCADSTNQLRCFLVNYDKASSHSAINESNFTGKSVSPSSQSGVPLCVSCSSVL
ncbi:unnamed protein product [Dicrocoelium dendriticum]|nr:unnamed protein product [Dicrocoelium dendriticum]